MLFSSEGGAVGQQPVRGAHTWAIAVAASAARTVEERNIAMAMVLVIRWWSWVCELVCERFRSMNRGRSGRTHDNLIVYHPDAGHLPLHPHFRYSWEGGKMAELLNYCIRPN